jgi:hypothetical protein
MNKILTILAAALIASACTKDSHNYEFIVANLSNQEIYVEYTWQGQEIMDTAQAYNSTVIYNARHTFSSEQQMTMEQLQSMYSCKVWSADSSIVADLSNLGSYEHMLASEPIMGLVFHSVNVYIPWRSWWFSRPALRIPCATVRPVASVIWYGTSSDSS